MSVEEAKGVLREDLDDLRDVMERLFANSPEKLAKARLHLDAIDHGMALLDLTDQPKSQLEWAEETE